MAYVRTYARPGSGLNELGLASVRMCGPTRAGLRDDCSRSLELVPAYVRVFRPAGAGLFSQTGPGAGVHVRMFSPEGTEALPSRVGSGVRTYVLVCNWSVTRPNQSKIFLSARFRPAVRGFLWALFIKLRGLHVFETGLPQMSLALYDAPVLLTHEPLPKFFCR